MTRELSRWGVGPKITVPMLLTALLAGAATWLWPEVCVVRAAPRYATIPCGVLLLAVGLFIWRLGVPAVMRAYNDDRLVTTGVFGWVRNPIYSAWIVFNIPGIALLCRSWPLLLPSLVGYTFFKRLIHRENEYLENRFGETYRTYKAEVPELFPRFWGKCWPWRRRDT
jgi:protein-S-isoprenylcysteine O-methyltransferase Ste14